MTKVEESNKKQEKKFCPLINKRCQRDCNFFQVPRLGDGYLDPAKCIYGKH